VEAEELCAETLIVIKDVNPLKNSRKNIKDTLVFIALVLEVGFILVIMVKNGFLLVLLILP
jgi:hypothetical protein